LIDPTLGPYLFDTSADSWLRESIDPAVRRWLAIYLGKYLKQVSAITVMERVRGYAMLITRLAPERRADAESARQSYLNTPGKVLPIDSLVALIAGELAVLLPQPPSPPKRSHRVLEVRQERLFRWRCDIMIAATALVAGMPLVHHNPRDFETIRMAIETSPERFPTLGPLNLVNVLRLAGS
jgi:predicted nucleic acid-binding protein